MSYVSGFQTARRASHVWRGHVTGGDAEKILYTFIFRQLCSLVETIETIVSLKRILFYLHIYHVGSIRVLYRKYLIKY